MVTDKSIMSGTSSVLDIAILGRMALGNTSSNNSSESPTGRFLLHYLPHFMQDYFEMQKIMEAEQPEIDLLWNATEGLFNDQYIQDATETGVLRWESMLGISPKGTDTLDERKFRIMAKMNQELPYTVRKLMQFLNNLCGEGNYSVELNSAEYRITVKLGLVSKNSYGEVEKILKRMIPANMTQDIQIMYNSNATIGKMSHAQLMEYTHEQLKSEVFE